MRTIQDEGGVKCLSVLQRCEMFLASVTAADAFPTTTVLRSRKFFFFANRCVDEFFFRLVLLHCPASLPVMLAEREREREWDDRALYPRLVIWIEQREAAEMLLMSSDKKKK